MKKAVVGFRVHSGWTALVAVSLEKGVPTVLSRQRLQLVEAFSFKFRQPFHTAETMRFKDASNSFQESGQRLNTSPIARFTRSNLTWKSWDTSWIE
jgi:hypothetical protein